MEGARGEPLLAPSSGAGEALFRGAVRKQSGSGLSGSAYGSFRKTWDKRYFEVAGGTGVGKDGVPSIAYWKDKKRAFVTPPSRRWALTGATLHRCPSNMMLVFKAGSAMTAPEAEPELAPGSEQPYIMQFTCVQPTRKRLLAIEAMVRALARTGVVFQSRALDLSLTVAQNFRYQGALHGMAWRDVQPRMTTLLARIGLDDRAGDKVGRLSGGQLRRVEIARALLHDPHLLLCDEATVGLDVKSRADIVADVHRLAAEDGVGVLWTTHLIDEIWPDDPVIVLHKGCILARGPARDLARDIAGDGTLQDAFLKLTGADADIGVGA